MIWRPYALIFLPTRFPHETLPADVLGAGSKIENPLARILVKGDEEGPAMGETGWVYGSPRAAL